MAGDKFSWFKDVEFARQTLAGLNPYSIRLITVCHSPKHLSVSSVYICRHILYCLHILFNFTLLSLKTRINYQFNR